MERKIPRPLLIVALVAGLALVTLWLFVFRPEVGARFLSYIGEHGIEGTVTLVVGALLILAAIPLIAAFLFLFGGIIFSIGSIILPALGVPKGSLPYVLGLGGLLLVALGFSLESAWSPLMSFVGFVMGITAGSEYTQLQTH